MRMPGASILAAVVRPTPWKHETSKVYLPV